MRYFIICFSFLLSFGFSAQEISEDKKVKFGVSVSTIHTRQRQDGLSAMLNINKGQHSISVGPRVSFSSIRIKTWNFNEDFILDFNYRYYPFKKLNKIKPFAQFSSEYFLNKYSWEEYYDHTSLQVNGPFIPYSFDAEYMDSRNYVNFYLGAGTEIVIWKNLSYNISGGIGWMFRSYKFSYRDISTNEIVYSNNTILSPSGGSWLFTTGLSFTF